jgi:ATP-dependent protease ClpP protease subunit
MRDIPGLRPILDRATALSAKARDARTAAPGAVPPSATISPAKVTDGVATLRLYDYIERDGGYWGISADELAEALDAVEQDVTRIDLRINSGGGAVWDGLAILNTLRSRPEPVRAVVDGIAASAASFIAVACDEVVMMPNSRMMIHDALGLCIGQAVDMREYADFLDDSSQNIAEIYATKTGDTADEWREVMTAKGLMGQWYSAQEAVAAGLADEVWESSNELDDRNPHAEALPPKVPAETQPDAADMAAFEERRLRMQRRRHAETERKLTPA